VHEKLPAGPEHSGSSQSTRPSQSSSIPFVQSSGTDAHASPGVVPSSAASREEPPASRFEPGTENDDEAKEEEADDPVALEDDEVEVSGPPSTVSTAPTKS
jgi:hypothetical protein